MGIKGYKGFNKDMTCRGFQYEIGQVYETDEDIELCSRGFHFCKKMSYVHNYYDLRDDNYIFCEVEAIGEVKEVRDKCVTNRIKIIRQLTKQEIFNLTNEGEDNAGIKNTGNGNIGDGNIGSGNIGNGNIGDKNIGNGNIGNGNIGDGNIGDRNTGSWNTEDRNTGDRNTGSWNTGHRNTGDWNTGSWNTGHMNTGDRNTGDWNTGSWNTGHMNTGDLNTGDRNTGDRNTGSWNTGSWNTGHRNTGDWNKTNKSSGVFCNQETKIIMFNKETDMTWSEWRNTRACNLLNNIQKNKWIYYDNMTEKEKQEHESAKTCGGYLKEFTRREAVEKWWQNLDNCEKKEIFNLPNFDLDIFNDIMETRITKQEYNKVISIN